MCAPAAVAVDTFWHSVMGVDCDGRALTPVLHPFDTRSAAAARELTKRVDQAEQHRRTGCMLHPSYLPAKLVWAGSAKASRWMSFGEYLFLRLFGVAAASLSMVSATGLWDQNEGRYDAEILAAIGASESQFAAPDALDRPCSGKLPWPELSGIPWFPALGDGACSNIGSGCVEPERFALMVGTSGAIRVLIEHDRVEIPPGLFCYRSDARRFLVGGALSNGGEVFAWMTRNLRVTDDANLAGRIPFQHGLNVLPLFAGERSPGWRSDARGAITGLSAATSAEDILQASLEAVALQFRQVYGAMTAAFGVPREVIASGGALLHSPVWTQMMANALGQSVTPCLEPEATSRGAALLALERIGAIGNIAGAAPKLGEPVSAVASHAKLYEAALARQKWLYSRLFEENS